LDNDTQPLLDQQAGPSKRGRKSRWDKFQEDFAAAMKKAKSLEDEGFFNFLCQ
jgi:hypothetical protein